MAATGLRDLLRSRALRFGSLATAVALILLDRIVPQYWLTASPPNPPSVARARLIDNMSMKDVHEALIAGRFDLVDDKISRVQLELPEDPLHWNHGNVVHESMTMKGLLALYRDGDTAAAKGYLMLAGQAPASPQLSSFGPSMLLANELLQRGEFETVETYLELCAAFWTTGAEQLASWRWQVHEHQIPNFGAQLYQ